MRPVVSLRASVLRLVSCACSASSAHARLIPASVLIATCSIAKADIWEVTKVNVWFIGVLLAVLLLITYVPQVSTAILGLIR